MFLKLNKEFLSLPMHTNLKKSDSLYISKIFPFILCLPLPNTLVCIVVKGTASPLYTRSMWFDVSRRLRDSLIFPVLLTCVVLRDWSNHMNPQHPYHAIRNNPPYNKTPQKKIGENFQKNKTPCQIWPESSKKSGRLRRPEKFVILEVSRGEFSLKIPNFRRLRRRKIFRYGRFLRGFWAKSRRRRAKKSVLGRF